MMLHVEPDGFQFGERTFRLFYLLWDGQTGEFPEVLHTGISPPSGVAFLYLKLIPYSLPAIRIHICSDTLPNGLILAHLPDASVVMQADFVP